MQMSRRTLTPVVGYGGMLYKRGRFYYLKFKFRGRTYYRTTKAQDLRTARRIETEIRSKVALKAAGVLKERQRMSLKDFLVKKFMPIYANAKPATLRYYDRGVKMLLAAGVGERVLSEVAPLDGVAVARIYAHLAPGTINCPLRTLRRALHLAEEWDLIDKAPRVRLRDEGGPRDRVLTEEELADYLRACPQPWRDIATIISELGLRPGETFTLRVDDFNTRGGLFRVVAGKSKAARRWLPITTKVGEILGRRNGDGWLFPAKNKDGHVNRDTVKKQHYQALRSTHIRPFPPYILRHTALTNLGERCDPFTLARIAGHSSIVMTLRYVHPRMRRVKGVLGVADGGDKDNEDL